MKTFLTVIFFGLIALFAACGKGSDQPVTPPPNNPPDTTNHTGTDTSHNGGTDTSHNGGTDTGTIKQDTVYAGMTHVADIVNSHGDTSVAQFQNGYNATANFESYSGDDWAITYVPKGTMTMTESNGDVFITPSKVSSKALNEKFGKEDLSATHWEAYNATEKKPVYLILVKDASQDAGEILYRLVGRKAGDALPTDADIAASFNTNLYGASILTLP